MASHEQRSSREPKKPKSDKRKAHEFGLQEVPGQQGRADREHGRQEGLTRPSGFGAATPTRFLLSNDAGA